MSRTNLRAYLWILAMITVAGLSGCGLSPNPEAASRPGNQAVSGAAKSPEVALACPGRIEGRSEAIEVGAAADGVLKAVYVKEGQTVKRGSLLAEIDCADLNAGLQAAEAEAESARQVRARLLRGSRDEEREMAAQRTAAARSVLERTALQLDRMQALYAKDEISRSALDDARRDQSVAEANLREATRHEQLVNAPPLPEEVVKADSDIAAAENRIRVIREKLTKCAVAAPIDGTILRVLRKKGESFSTLTPQPLFTIADLSVRRVRAEVDERDVLNVRVGQKVLVFPQANRNQFFEGIVTRTASTMGRKKILTGDPAEKADHDVLEAMIDFQPNAPQLPVGMRVVVQFLR